MGLGLLVSFAVAWTVAANEALFELVWSASDALTWALLLAPIAILVFLSFRMHRLPIGLVQGLYLAVTVLEGLALSLVSWLVPPEVFVAAFGAAATAFVAAGVVGLLVKRDLSSLGMVLTFALVGLLAALVTDQAWAHLPLPYIGVVLFTLLTAFDAWWLGRAVELVTDEEEAKRLAIWGAIDLYLDFVNLLLFLVEIFVSAALLDD
jgi:hypothetical protein